MREKARRLEHVEFLTVDSIFNSSLDSEMLPYTKTMFACRVHVHSRTYRTVARYNVQQINDPTFKVVCIQFRCENVVVCYTNHLSMTCMMNSTHLGMMLDADMAEPAAEALFAPGWSSLRSREQANELGGQEQLM